MNKINNVAFSIHIFRPTNPLKEAHIYGKACDVYLQYVLVS